MYKKIKKTEQQHIKKNTNKWKLEFIKVNHETNQDVQLVFLWKK